MPKTVKAKVSDNSYKDVAVIWDKKTVNTSKVGSYTFKGKVKGYTPKVTLVVKVKERTTKLSTFLIGGIGPLTGEASYYGTAVKQGAEIAVKEINDAGGVTVGNKKVKLKLDYRDDQATADNAVTCYNQLSDAGADAILGTVTSGSC